MDSTNDIEPASPSSRQRAPLMLALSMLPLALVTADTLAGFDLGWRPYGNIEHALLALLAAAWAATALAWRLPALRRCALPRAESLALGLCVACLCWGLVETLAARLETRLRPGAAFHTRGPLLHRTIHPDPEFLPGITGDSVYTTDAQGIRAPRPPAPGDRKILCIGGSTTECVYLDDTETWPALLMAEREGVWIGNVGISGFDTRDHLRFLQESPLMEGIDTIVMQPGINDLWRYLADEETETRFDRFEEAPANAPASAPPPSELWRPLWTRSRVIQLVHTLRLPPPAPEVSEGTGGAEYAIRRAKRAAAPIIDTMPDLDRGLREYRARLAACAQACEQRGVRLVVTTQPVLWRADLPQEDAARCWFGWRADGAYYSLAVLRNCMDAYNATLRQWAATAAVPCINLDALNGIPENFYDDCHFTEQGARQVAAQVTDLLRPQSPTP